jgi:hypothetical protein
MKPKATTFKIIICNKPHVLAAFFMEVSKLSDFFQCHIKVVEKVRLEKYPVGMNFWPVALGEVVELQIIIRDQAPRVLLEIIESLIAQQLRAAGFCCN